MSRYTKGPWKSIIEEEQPVPYYKRLICTVEHGDEYKAVVAERSEVCNREEWEFNTRLIAAAPELLEACKYALKTLSKVDIEIETTKIHKAINKAEGDNDEN